MPPFEGNYNGTGIHSRFLFNSREQENSESLDDFVGHLLKLSDQCHYEGASSKFITLLVRDRLIAGIRNKEIQRRLLNCPDNVSLEKAVEVAKSIEVGKTKIKIEQSDDEMPSIHDKLQVQVSVGMATSSLSSLRKPDIKVTEEAKIAILIELLNHKTVLIAPSGHEAEKAELWEKIFTFATSKAGAPGFKNALHLREVFGSWKNVALQARHQNQNQGLDEDDVKVSNSDKLIWDLFGQDQADQADYPMLASNNFNNQDLHHEAFGDEDIDDDDAEAVEYEFDENDLAETSEEDVDDQEEEEIEDDEEYTTSSSRRNSRGRPRKTARAAPTMITTATKIQVLKRLLPHKDVIATASGYEKEKKIVWASTFNSMSGKLNVDSPSALRQLFRNWKVKALKKKDNSDEVITETDKLIYKIFADSDQNPNISENLAEDYNDDLDDFDDVTTTTTTTNDNVIDAKLKAIPIDPDAGKTCIDHNARIAILQEMAKYRQLFARNQASVYEKESAWREIHEKTVGILNFKNLSVKMLKDLVKSWQAGAFHRAIKQGGPVSTLQKLMYHIYMIDKRAAVPFANLDHGLPPGGQLEVKGCTHFSPEVKIAIFKELLHYATAKSVNSADETEMWETICNLAGNAPKVKVKFAIKTWKYKAMRMARQGEKAKNKADRLAFELYGLKAAENSLDEEDDFDEIDNLQVDLSDLGKLTVIQCVEMEPLVLCSKIKPLYKSHFWSKTLEKVQKADSDNGLKITNSNQLKKIFWRWTKTLNDGEMAVKITKQLQDSFGKANGLSEEFKAAVLQEVFQNQQIVLYGNREEQLDFWQSIINSNIATKHGLHFDDGAHLAMAFGLWKDAIIERLKEGCHYQLRPCERMILEICIGPTSQSYPSSDLHKTIRDSIVAIIQPYATIFKTGSAKSQSKAWSDISEKAQSQHGPGQLADPNLLFKLIKRWKLLILKKQEFDEMPSESESLLLDYLGLQHSDSQDSDLLSFYEDSSTSDLRVSVIIPDSAKALIVNSVISKSDLVYGNNLRDLSNFWSESLDQINQDFPIACKGRPPLLQRAFFSWTFEAWTKQMANVYLSPHETLMLDLAFNKKAAACSNYSFSDHLPEVNEVDVVDISETVQATILKDLMDFKELLQSDKAMFWTLALRIAQSFWVNCDTPARLFLTFHSWRLRAQQKVLESIPLTSTDNALFDLFQVTSGQDDTEDDGEDFIEVENLWDRLKEADKDMSESARMAILTVLASHKDLISGRTKGWGNDKIAVWQKALNVAIEEGVKFTNHRNLMKTVRQWRAQAKCNEADGLALAPWERTCLNIFNKDDPIGVIKEELEDQDQDDDVWTSKMANLDDGTKIILVPENVKMVMAKAMLKHKPLLQSINSGDQDIGWRKVYRIAHANGAFYDSISTMRSNLRAWKQKAVAKLKNNPKTINQLDKYMFMIYDINTGDLDLESLQDKPQHESKSKALFPATKLSSGAKMSILEEMYRNKEAVSSLGSDHKMKFFGWKNVLRVAKSVGGEFDSLASLTSYIKHQLTSPAEAKIQSRERINELDTLVFKIYDDLDSSGLDYEPEFNLPESGLNQQQHQQQHVCRLCQVSYQRFDQLRGHQQMVHGQDPEADIDRKCRICGLDVGLEKAAVRAHFRSNHPQDAFQCDLCSNEFLNDQEYYQHIQGHESYNALETIEELSDSEDECLASKLPIKREFRSTKLKKRGAYRKRVKIELPPPDTDEVPKIGKKEGGLCPHCGEYYKHVQQHIMYKHETKKPWKCDQCDYAHALQKGLQEHIRNCHPKESDLKVCHICGYKTTLNHNLKEHIERTHEKKRRFTCNLCDAHFYRKNVMERHVRASHMGELINECKDCGQKFKHDSTMIAHVNAVHKSLYYMCRDCPKYFSCTSTLRKHRRMVHASLDKGVKYKRTFVPFANQQQLQQQQQQQHHQQHQQEQQQQQQHQQHHQIQGN